jgi:hypothetical protein
MCGHVLGGTPGVAIDSNVVVQGRLWYVIGIRGMLAEMETRTTSDVDSNVVGADTTVRGRAIAWRCESTVRGLMPPNDGMYGTSPSSRSAVDILFVPATIGRRGSSKRLSKMAS